MSDRPLFQDTDEEEAAYAPQQLPENADQTSIEEGSPAADATLPIGVLPIAAAGSAASGVGPGAGGGSAGSVSGVVPAIGAVALADELEKNDEAERRD